MLRAEGIALGTDALVDRLWRCYFDCVKRVRLASHPWLCQKGSASAVPVVVQVAACQFMLKRKFGNGNPIDQKILKLINSKLEEKKNTEIIQNWNNK